MEHITATCGKLTGFSVLRYMVNVVATEFYWVKSFFCVINFLVHSPNALFYSTVIIFFLLYMIHWPDVNVLTRFSMNLSNV